MLTLGNASLASCRLVYNPAFIGPAQIQQFGEAPESLLLAYPDGGYLMSLAVMQVAVTSPRIAVAIVRLAPAGAPRQQSAMGEGLKVVASFCAPQDPLLAERIKTAVMSSQAGAMKRAFLFNLNGDDAESDGPGRPQIGAIPSVVIAAPPLPLQEPVPQIISGEHVADPFQPPIDWP
jgi:hypothetical protein